MTVWTAVVLAAVLVCAGCAGRPDLEADRAQTLQESVLAVTQAAGEARWADAQSLLLTTRTTLDDGVDAGEVSTTRYREIDAALDLVATELAAAQAAADQAAAEQAAAEQAAAEQAAAEQAAAEKAAAEQNAPAAPKKEPPAPKDKGKPGK
ncbi:hypothetical protein CTE05_00020 [Cellulomonas terrae]|uniref:Mucin-associated surface protein n=1 Tax=Cellulomonas terrae TaxID=311234 RepID=A0A511JER0_9CELL|nr:hypothetical protein CTE05_00020 [Cellulomonas terrae]